MKDSIFREYDIRGVPGKDFDIEEAFDVGRGFGSLVGPGKFVVARDVRTTSYEISRKVIKGLVASGCDVVDIGVVPTSIFNFSVKRLKADGGICVTASHNPPEYNGFKFRIKDGMTFSGDKLKKLMKVIKSGDFKSGEGEVKKKDMAPQYFRSLNKIKLKRKLKVVIDCGNGTCSKFALKIFENAGCDVLGLYCVPNGRFPNHIPDPMKDENLVMLRKKVISEKADIGIAFDNDGDRVGFLDDKGKILRSDIALAFLVKPFLKKGKNVKIVHDVKFSRAFIEFAEENGGIPVMTRVGYPNIIKEMIEKNTKIGGEFSGHFYYLDNGYYSDGMMTGLKLLEQISKEKKPLSELVKPFTRYYSTQELRVRVPEHKVGKIIDKLTAEFKKKNYKINDIDGIRVEFADGWALVRASKTEPVLSMRFEANSEKNFKKIRKFVLDEVSLVE